jgi:hypothetical protein
VHTLLLLIALLVAIGVAQMWPTPSSHMTGRITAIEPGQWIVIRNDMMDPQGLRFALVESTVLDGDARLLGRDVQVRIDYAAIGEGQPVARRVRVITAPATRR